MSDRDWMSVKERLPAIGQEVIGGAFIQATFMDGSTTSNWQQALMIWDGKKWRDSDTGDEDGASHWMPLPNPPIEEKTEAGKNACTDAWHREKGPNADRVCCPNCGQSSV